MDVKKVFREVMQEHLKKSGRLCEKVERFLEDYTDEIRELFELGLSVKEVKIICNKVLDSEVEGKKVRDLYYISKRFPVTERMIAEFIRKKGIKPMKKGEKVQKVAKMNKGDKPVESQGNGLGLGTKEKEGHREGLRIGKPEVMEVILPSKF